MKHLRPLLLAAAALLPLAPTLLPAGAPAQDEREVAPLDMAQAMARAARYTQPGEQHELLGLLVGEWEVESRMTMLGDAAPVEKGRASTRWKVDGRWLESEWNGQLMGMAGRTFSLLGYDNFKMSYVWTGLGNFDTAMNHAEGDLTPDGEALILYGTVDEYLTGEHDKMVKYVHRFAGERGDDGGWERIDRIVLEVHDLPIGERGTQVLEFVFTRAE